jgi:subtilisin family serine protease
MKKFIYLSAIILTVSCSKTEFDNSGSSIQLDINAKESLLSSTSGKTIPSKFIIVLKDDNSVLADNVKSRGRALGILKRNSAAESNLGFVYSKAIQGFSATLSPAMAAKLAKDPEVKYIEPDMEINLGPITIEAKPTRGGGGTVTPTQTTPWGINDVGGTGNGTGKKAFIIDTGIDLTHPDLAVDRSLGFTAFTSGKDANLNDGNGHGTHVAGTVAALNNNIGVVGVAAGATVIPIKVLDSRGSGSNSGVIAGIDHVFNRGQEGDVANMSLGGSFSQALNDAVLRASLVVKFVVAAGNSGANAANYSPASANGSNIYTIAAHSSNWVFASFSNYGNPPVDYSAPGVSIYSTYKGGGYTTLQGTSMAAPHVAGILLLGGLNQTNTTISYITDSRNIKYIRAVR